MKLFSIATLSSFVFASDEWEISMPKVKFDKSDEGYEMFLDMERVAKAEDQDTVFGLEGRAQIGNTNESIQKMQLRKYETIKKMTLLLHAPNDREWGRYCPYGCHCMVNGPHDIMSGRGNPVDEIDSACKRHQECIACAMRDFGADVCPWWKPYKMTAMVDDETNEKFLMCQDAEGFCKRSLCECDAQLARDIFEERKTYDRNFHHRYGTFSKDECRTVNRGKYEEVKGEKKTKPEAQCCGKYPKRFSYSPAKQECCGDQLASIGTC